MISYTYTVSGAKISQQLESGDKGGTSTRRDYAGAFVFVNNAPGWVSTPHGRFVYIVDGWQNEFHLRDHLGNTRVVLMEEDTGTLATLQQNHYYPFGMLNPSLSTTNTLGALKDNRYLYNGKEFNDDFDLNWYDYGARFYDAQIGRWHSIDPLAEDFAGISPYVYVANNPIILIDPDGRSWRPTNSDGNPNGYEWVPEDESYDDDGNLLDGLYHQAIFFTENYTFDENSDYNMGSATAVVYLADGTKVEYDSTTRPSDADDYATVPEGRYEAKVGLHNGSYTALRMGDVGTTDFSNNRIELGTENPAYSDGRTYATGINIHKAGLNNKTGMTTSGSPISAGCSLIDRDNWSGFIGNFNTDAQKNNTVSVSLSRTYSTPLNFNWTTPVFNTQVDNTRVVIPYRR
jgi:RHS repeat-associated protein